MTQKIGVIGIPGKWSTEVLADALEERTGFRLVMDLGNITARLSDNSLWYGDTNLCDLDGLVVKKASETYSPNSLDRLELLRLAEAAGVRVFSRTETIIRMLDRLACTMTLSTGGIPMPDTVVTENVDDALQAVRNFGSAVFKPMYSTKARGMCVIHADQDEGTIRAAIQAFKADNPMMYLQRKLDLGDRDYGMVFLGGEYLGSYARIGDDSAWNTTINSGGKYALHEPEQSVIDLATKAQALFGMDFTTVDVADTPDGPIIFEVSAFGGFKGAKEGMNLDAAALYADYILKELG